MIEWIFEHLKCKKLRWLNTLIEPIVFENPKYLI